MFGQDGEMEPDSIHNSGEPMSLVDPDGVEIQIDSESGTEMENETEFESELGFDSEEPDDNDNY